MSPPPIKLGDLCSGHGCYPARPSISASPNVFINGIAVVRQNDSYETHGCDVCLPHGGVLSSGSPNVYVNNVQIGREGDPVSCGSSATSSCTDVNIN